MQFGPRNIKSGTEYDKYFGKAAEESIAQGNNSVKHNVEIVIPQIVNKYKYQAAKIADVLYDANLEQFCKNIWSFLFNHIQYEYDKIGREQFRTPWRSWHDRKEGIDCDCFSIFTSCILSNKNIPHCIRITKYNYNEDWQHIYIIVPKRGVSLNPYEPSTYYTIDAVIHSFNTEKEFTDQKTYKMSAQLGIVTEVLNGIEDAAASEPEVVETLLGLGSPTNKELDAIKKHIRQTREWIANNPTLYRAQGGDPVSAMKMYDYALDNFDKGAEIREKAFQALAENEARYNREVLKLDDADLDGIIDDDDFQFSGIGDLGKTKAERKAARATKKAAKAEKKAEKKEIKSQSKVERKEERKEEKAERKEERTEAQGFFRKVGVALKQGGEAVFVKYNPAVIAARTGFLVALKLNMFRLASRLAPGYGTDNKAAKKMLEKVIRIFDDKLQGSTAELKEAIMIGAIQKTPDLKGIGLGFVVSAATAASVLSATAVIAEVLKAVKSVEVEEGIDSGELGSLGEMDDDYSETMQFLYGLAQLGEAAQQDGAAIGQLVKAVAEYVKNFFAKIKANKAETEGMTKEEKKTYKQAKKDEAKSYKSKTTGADMQKIRTAAGTFIDKITGKETGPDSTEQAIVDMPNQSITEAGQKSWFARNWMWLAGGGLAVAAAGYALFAGSGNTAKKEKQALGTPAGTTSNKVIKIKL